METKNRFRTFIRGGIKSGYICQEIATYHNGRRENRSATEWKNKASRYKC